MPQHLNDHSLPAGFDAKYNKTPEAHGDRLAKLEDQVAQLQQRVKALEDGKTTKTVGGDDSTGGSQ